jgi:hypothetical protein
MAVMDQGWRQKRRLNMLAMFVLAASLAGCSGKERTLYSPPAFIKYEHPPPPAVRVIVPVDGTTFHAHADIRLLALATPYGTSLGPDEDAGKAVSDSSQWDLLPDRQDTYSVEFMAGTNSLNLQTSGLVSARPKSKPGQAEHYIMVVVGYPAVEWVWHDVPAGTYTLTAKVTNQGGLATVSAPVNITVLP